MTRPAEYLNINKDKVYLKLAFAFFLIWLFFKGPLRHMLEANDLWLQYLLGLAPNFFAAITLAFWQTYITSSSPRITFFCVIIILGLGEIVQQFIPGQTPDVLDFISSLIGCFLAILFIKSRMDKQQKNGVA
ncbi:MAG: hypothetical protein V4721_00060 [Bacteroidota bacterium]